MPYYKKLYIYRDSKLPEKGWIQSCFNCYTFTSNTIDYIVLNRGHFIYECDVYLCRACDKMLHRPENINKQLRFRVKCNRYIRHLFPG